MEGLAVVSLPLRLLTLEATLKPGVAWPPHCVELPSKDGPRRGAGNLFCYVRQCSILIFTLRMEVPALPSAASKAGTGFLRSPVSPGLGEFCCKLSKISKHSPLIRLVKERFVNQSGPTCSCKSRKSSKSLLVGAWAQGPCLANFRSSCRH